MEPDMVATEPAGRRPAVLESAAGGDLLLVDELLTEEERAIRDRVRGFCDAAVLPIINDYWERGQFPVQLVERLAALQVVGGPVTGNGCPGISPVASGLVATELARADGGIRDFFAVQELAILTIDMLGDDDQKRRWLPSLARMERIGAFAMTEPTHGSDASSLQTRARKNSSHYILDGGKRWITNGSIADLLVLWARDEDGAVGGFILEPPLDGLDATPMDGKAACRTADHAELRLTGVKVPLDHRLEHARSFADTSRVLVRSRQGVAWEALGHAMAAYDAAVAHTLDRQQFGRPLAASQLIQARLAAMLVDLTTMALLCWRVGRLDQERRATAAMASAVKLHAAAVARRIVLEARDLLGGDGLLLDRHLARHLLDMEAVSTYEGTHSINALIVGRAITGLSAFHQ
jgi:glutaryl-CoA dehydrogenase